MHKSQYSSVKLQEDGTVLLHEQNKVFPLNEGWRYVENSVEKLLATTPSSLNTNEVTTFALTLHVPKEQQTYSLNVNGIHQTFELWLNNELIHSTHLLKQHPFIHFYAETRTVEIKLVITPTNERIAFLQTPLLGQTDVMYSLLFQELVTGIIAVMSLLAVGIYSIFLYCSKQKQFVHLIIGVYFLLVCGSLLLSTDTISFRFFQFAPSLYEKMKTILGLLSIMPLYVIVSLLNKHIVNKRKLLLFFIIITFTIVIVLLLPLERFLLFEIIIWSCLISILIFQFLKMIVFSIKNQSVELKTILLLQTFFYLIIYLSLRVYYHVYGTDLHTRLWLITFTISICMYITIYQNRLIQELEHMKLDALQSKLSFFNAQIKPHFLYNAISNIIALCYIDNLKAAHLLNKFSTYLRIIFENNAQQDWITLEKELTLVDAYVEIEKARFPEKIHYVLEVDEHVRALKIPTLSVQPFVENAIRHGLFNKDGAGTVYVNITRNIENVFIIINDDGVGMTSEQLNDVLEGQQVEQGIGIRNVIQRLRFIPNSTFEMKSTVNEGTSIQITIPITT